MININGRKERYFLFNKKMYQGAIECNSGNLLIASLTEFENEEDFLSKLKEVFDRTFEGQKGKEEEWEREKVPSIKKAEYYISSFEHGDLEFYKVSNIKELFKNLPFDKEMYFSYTDQIPIADCKNEYEREIQDTINLFKKLNPDTLYTALLLYDVGGVDEPTREQIKKVSKIWNEVETLYDEEVRYKVMEATNSEQNNEEEMG